MDRRMILRKTVIALLALTLCFGTMAVDTHAAEKDEEKGIGASAAAFVDDLYKASIKNPLTGLGHYNEKAVGKRPVAIVVENDPKARPQWAIDDKKHSPDIILEGELEGGETRMLWFWADMTEVPDQVGPVRSARPPYIRFSQLFDAIFIHLGQSASGGDYVGADTVFSNEGVDHINYLQYKASTQMFDRDFSRTNMLEHTGYLKGSKIKTVVKEYGFRTKLNEDRFSELIFREETKAEEGGLFAGIVKECGKIVDKKTTGRKTCKTLDVHFSGITDTRHWVYSKDDKMYHTEDYYTDVARTNILVLFDETSYISKWIVRGGVGMNEVYCDYSLAGGKGKLAARGKVEDITWSVENGKLVIKDKSGEPAKLVPGKTWIGWGSSNQGGSVDIGK